MESTIACSKCFRHFNVSSDILQVPNAAFNVNRSSMAFWQWTFAVIPVMILTGKLQALQKVVRLSSYDMQPRQEP